MTAEITGTTLTFNALSFSYRYQGEQCDYPDDSVVNCTGQVGCGRSVTMGYEAIVAPLSVNTYGVTVRYVTTDHTAAGPTNGFQANWRLEGVMTTVPLPPPATLLGSGLLGFVAMARRVRKRF
jgi:hypothetical protein